MGPLTQLVVWAASSLKQGFGSHWDQMEVITECSLILKAKKRIWALVGLGETT